MNLQPRFGGTSEGFPATILSSGGWPSRNSPSNVQGSFTLLEALSTCTRSLILADPGGGLPDGRAPEDLRPGQSSNVAGSCWRTTSHRVTCQGGKPEQPPTLPLTLGLSGPESGGKSLRVAAGYPPTLWPLGLARSLFPFVSISHPSILEVRLFIFGQSQTLTSLLGPHSCTSGVLKAKRGWLEEVIFWLSHSFRPGHQPTPRIWGWPF